MIKSKEELIEAVKAGFDGNDSDAVISILEDITDTIDDLETRTESADEWRAKYEANDKEWRKRYIDRFSGAVETVEEPSMFVPEEEEKTNRYEDLFKEVK